jgi:hypothetical protein
MRIYGGIQQGGNLGQVARGNPLLDPRFKIQGGEPWNKTPILPGKETKDFEDQPFPAPILPPATGNLLAQGLPPMGNVGASFVPSFQNPVIIPEGFEQQLNQMEEDTKQQQINRFISPGLYPKRYVY